MLIILEWSMNKYVIRYDLGWLYGSKYTSLEGALDNDYLNAVNIPPRVCADFGIDDLYYVFKTTTSIISPFQES